MAKSMFPFNCICGNKYDANSKPIKQPQTQAWRLGYWLEQLLGVFGITRDRYVRVKVFLGLQPKCGCKDRQQFLDKLGVRLSVQWLKVVERVQALFNRTEKH